MLKIDAHQYFWNYDSARDEWIDESMLPIRRDFLPEDLQPVLQKNGIDGCVVISSNDSAQENYFQLKNAVNYDFIKGIVGWVDLKARDIEDVLCYYKQFDKMKGFQYIFQSESRRDFMLNPDFTRGLRLLRKYNFTFDLLVNIEQLKYTKDLVALFPDQRFVLDHMGKSLIREKEISIWRKNIVALAGHENVYCKISGIGNEENWHTGHLSDFTLYMDVIVETFGIKRLMFGSDWPVCLLGGTYEKMLGVVATYFSSFSKDERQQFFGGNATEFYNL